MIHRLAFALLLWAGGLAAAGAATDPVLRQSIDTETGFVRLHALDADLAPLRAALAEKRAVVLDLRFVSGDLPSALRLGGLLAQRAEGIEGPRADPQFHRFEKPPDADTATGHHPLVIVLVNQATAGPVEAVLDALQAAGDVLLVGPGTAGECAFRAAGGDWIAGSGVACGLPVAVTPDADRRAYDALEAGTPIGELLDRHFEKRRFDEALLIREHARNNGNHGPVTSDERSRQVGEPATSPENTPPSPDDDGESLLIDRILQRAVHVIAAARALGRI